MIPYLALLLPLLTTCNGYKYLVYSPIFGYSHTHFMGSIADTLTKAGHNVTMLMPILDEEQEHKTGVYLTKNIIKVPRDSRVAELAKFHSKIFEKVWILEPSLSMLKQTSYNMTMWFTYQCERVLNDKALIKWLKEENFDVGVAETFSICGLGVFELAKIRTTVATFSGVHLDFIAEAIGEPSIPSYVPGAMSTAGDRMSFAGRFSNLIETIFGRYFFTSTFDGEIEAFRASYGADFKGWKELVAQSLYMLTNSNPYLDYPRPTLEKTVQIGGFAVSIDPEKNKLSAEWDAILGERNTTVLVSFGSVAKAICMPELYRNTLLEIFESMPDTTFIMNYEKETNMADHLPNVYLAKWLPQNALLADSRLTAFVTHGGLGSTTEIAYHGKPAVLIPIFADQPRNAQMLAKHGGSIVLSKFDLETPEKLRNSIIKIFEDASYSQNAKRLSEMLLHQPIDPKQSLLRHLEFAAKFGNFSNLDPYSRQLFFIQYHLIDIISAVVGAFILIAYVTSKLVSKSFTFSLKKKTE